MVVAREDFHSGWPVRQRTQAEAEAEAEAEQNKQVDAQNQFVPTLPLLAATRQPIRSRRRPKALWRR